MKLRRTKQAATLERGGIATRIPAHFLGGALNTLELAPVVTGDLSPYRAGKMEEERELLERMEEEYPQELSNVKVISGGGTRALDTIRRHFTNPRTTVLGKTVGLPMTLASALAGGLFRQPLYSPYADEVYSPWDNPGVLSHELGHAVDYNSKPGKRLLRDLYPYTRIVPGGSLRQEILAWNKAKAGINAILRRRGLSARLEEKAVDTYSKTRGTALGTYAAGEIGDLFPEAAPVAYPLAVLYGRLGTVMANRQAVTEGREDLAPPESGKTSREKQDEAKTAEALIYGLKKMIVRRRRDFR
jgi:hypothetical protein